MLVLYFIAFAVVMASIVIHELGHVRAMQAYGVKIDKIAIGYPLRFLTYHTTIGKGKDKIPFSLSPLIFIGYVKPSAEGQSHWMRLGTQRRMIIAGNGPRANLILGSFLIALALLLGMPTSTGVLVVLSFVAFALAMIVYPRACMVYVFPVLGTLFFGLFWHLILRNTGSDSGDSGSIFKRILEMEFYEQIRISIALSGSVNLVLGAFNLIPLPFLDGGHQAMAIMDHVGVSKNVMSLYWYVGSVILAVTILAQFIL